jgi:hypothetical protein
MCEGRVKRERREVAGRVVCASCAPNLSQKIRLFFSPHTALFTMKFAIFALVALAATAAAQVRGEQ